MAHYFQPPLDVPIRKGMYMGFPFAMVIVGTCRQATMQQEMLTCRKTNCPQSYHSQSGVGVMAVIVILL